MGLLRCCLMLPLGLSWTWRIVFHVAEDWRTSPTANRGARGRAVVTRGTPVGRKHVTYECSADDRAKTLAIPCTWATPVGWARLHARRTA